MEGFARFLAAAVVTEWTVVIVYSAVALVVAAVSVVASVAAVLVVVVALSAVAKFVAAVLVVVVALWFPPFLSLCSSSSLLFSSTPPVFSCKQVCVPDHLALHKQYTPQLDHILHETA